MEADSTTVEPPEDYRRLFEEAPEPYLLTDLEGRIELCNARAAELLGRTATQLTGSAIEDHVAPGQSEAIRATLERVGSGERISAWEVRLAQGAAEPRVLASIERSGDGHLRWVLWDALPLQLVRERLHHLVELSQDDVAALRALAEWQASLLGAAGQDLRTPLRVIQSTIDSLLEPAAEVDAATTRVMLERTAEQVGKLQRLLPTLLQLGKVQLRHSADGRQRVDLPRLVDETLHDLGPLDHAVDYAFDVTTIEADPDQLQRVVLELVTHADAHGPDGTTLTIGTESAGVDVDLYLDAPRYAMSEDVREVLFSPFLGTGRGGEEANGDDLGLSLVAVFARMHGGRAHVEDAPDGGTSFRVLLSNALPDRRNDVAVS